jgi:hypothetical protein
MSGIDTDPRTDRIRQNDADPTRSGSTTLIKKQASFMTVKVLGAQASFHICESNKCCTDVFFTWKLNNIFMNHKGKIFPV